jgi:hypothetical protein
MAVQIGLPPTADIDLEVTWPSNGQRVTRRIEHVRLGSKLVLNVGR